MGLQPTITAAQSRNGEILDVTDTTGEYNVTTNPYGYGKARTAGVISVDTATDIITLASHGLANNEVVTITDVGSITGFNLYEAYYVIFISNNEFSLSLTPNGSAIDFSGTVGTFDFIVGWVQSSLVARTIFKVENYADGEIRDTDYLDSGTFIPQGTTTDTATITSVYTNGDTTATTIQDAEYAVTMIPIWEPPYTASFTSASSITISSVDLADMFSNAQYLYVVDSSIEYLLEILSIELSGSDTIITLIEDSDFNGNSYTSAQWGLGIPATNYVPAYYNAYVCYQKEASSLTPSDISCEGSGGVSTTAYQDTEILNMYIQGAIAANECGDYDNANAQIVAANKKCNVINNQRNNNCGCH